MEALIAITYRCNAKCYMCNTWQFPTDTADEITPQQIEKIPAGLKFVNITGGEPFIRQDIEDIISVVKKKTDRIVISTNGYYTNRVIALANKYPELGFRISIEGLPDANDQLRGIENGFDHGLRTLLELKEMGLKDIGFGITVSDRNAKDLMELYTLAKSLNVEFATAIVHNSYYFHKHDNSIEDKEMVAKEFERLAKALLKSKKVKDWFRAYFNNGIINYIYGGKRLLPCEMGSDVFFIDPHGDVMPCNAMDRSMGNIKKQAFEDIWDSSAAEEVRNYVASCDKNCWMIGSVSPAMKKNKLAPMKWIIQNKWLGKEAD